MSEQASLGPKRIKEIRESLGLSQAEAGNLIGGGPKAFGKYESGVISPTASVENLLKILNEDPNALKILRGIRFVPFEHLTSNLLEVSGQHVSVLSPHSFPLLIRKLLSAEALTHGLPMDGLHVAAKITVSDDGEDARIEWEHGPERTKFLSNRLNQFQLKAGPIPPKKAGNEVLKTDGTIKAEIADVLARGGIYTMLCAHSYNHKEIRARINAIITTLREAGAIFNDKQVTFRDADQIAEWINQLPMVSSWLLERTRPGMVGPLRPWSYWAESPEHNIKFIEDKRLIDMQNRLISKASKKRSVTRVLGFSGVGKSRLVLESFSPTQQEDESGIQLSDLVLYGDEQIAGTIQLKSVIQSLADSSYRAIVIVNRCTAGTQQDLAALVKRTSSELSLITLHDEISQENVDDDPIIIPEAHCNVIDGIIKQISPENPLEDHQRLVKLSHGFPRMAVLISQSWLRGHPTATAPEDLVQIILGEKYRQQTYRGVASLLAVFGSIGPRPNIDDELIEIAKLGRNITVEDLRSEIEELTTRGIVQRRGKMIVILPRPIALRLAERQWREWSKDRWDDIITGNLSTVLRNRALTQLALLNTTSIALDVTRHLCRYDGPLDTIEKICKNGCSITLPSLAEIDAETTLSLIERLIHDLSENELRTIVGEDRRNFVRALEKILFYPKTFERGARLLLSLAVAENESWGNNATGQFKSLFPSLAAETSADGKIRLRFIDDEIQHSNNKRLLIVANALLEGCKTHSFMRTLGSESHGSRPALKSWYPIREEYLQYVSNCTERLISVIKIDKSIGEIAKKGLAQQLHAFIFHIGIDFVENVISQIMDICGPYWPDALETLEGVMIHDKNGLSPSDLSRLISLIKKLKPSNLEDRIKYLVTEMPWDFPRDIHLDFKVKNQHQQQAVESLVQEMLKIPGAIENQLKNLNSGCHRMSLVFGNALAKHSQDSEKWYPALITTLEELNPDVRNFDLLSGYLAGLSELDKNKLCDNFKEMAVKSKIFIPSLPHVCFHIGITKTDIELVSNAIKSGSLEPKELWIWTRDDVFAGLPPKEIAPLLDILFEMDGVAYAIALELLGRYIHDQLKKVDDIKSEDITCKGFHEVFEKFSHIENREIDLLLPQALLVASNIPNDKTKILNSQMGKYYFHEIMSWILRKGKDNINAQRVALVLSKKLIEDCEDPADLIKPLLPELLENFSEIIWPLLGQSIVSDQKIRWKFEHILGDRFTLDERKKCDILKLPENVLFAWCHTNPDIAPAFVASIVPVLTICNVDSQTKTFHPIFKRLLDEFGNQKDVLDSINRNIHTFGWQGSRTNYYVLYEQPLRSLDNHLFSQVRDWAQRMLGQLELEKINARYEDEEHQFF